MASSNYNQDGQLELPLTPDPALPTLTLLSSAQVAPEQLRTVTLYGMKAGEAEGDTTLAEREQATSFDIHLRIDDDPMPSLEIEDVRDYFTALVRASALATAVDADVEEVFL